MNGAMAKAMPAASPALRASCSRGHSSAERTLPAAIRQSRRGREGPPVCVASSVVVTRFTLGRGCCCDNWTNPAGCRSLRP